MKIFISWSGEPSKAVATALRGWLPKVIQSVKPWMSERDIPKGTRWSDRINEQLADVKTGIVCLTPDNLGAPWILFESGAMAKSLDEAYVCPYLFRLEPSAVEWPLAQFNLTKAEKADTLKLLMTINSALGDQKFNQNVLEEVFEKFWPDLDRELSAITLGQVTAPRRSDHELLEEILYLVRQINRPRSDAILNRWFSQPIPAATPQIDAAALATLLSTQLPDLDSERLQTLIKTFAERTRAATEAAKQLATAQEEKDKK